jgi:hypothetical protein
MLQRLARVLGLAALTVLLLGIGALILIVLFVTNPLGVLLFVGAGVFALFLLLLYYPKWRRRKDNTPRPFPELRPLEPQPARRGVTDPEVSAALNEAEARLRRLAAASQRLASAQARQSLGRIVTTTDRILDEIAADPRDLQRARRFLKVFLDGLTDVVERYAAAEDAGRSASLDENFLSLLREMEKAADDQLARLRSHELDRLDITIDVLKDRLAREGIGS